MRGLGVLRRESEGERDIMYSALLSLTLMLGFRSYMACAFGVHRRYRRPFCTVGCRETNKAIDVPGFFRCRLIPACIRAAELKASRKSGAWLIVLGIYWGGSVG